ncbi:biopolymer transport protein ExbD [mine drainage metagenome]|uniref:Biopolymer transport protein ExbD n=1 Tax=mine drainage metagenome TaxID=410659 RepID=A0A1J5TFB7_9ZZZZ
MIDLGFTLLIIFMIATPLINQEQHNPVNLPVTSKAPLERTDKNLTFETITITKSGSYLWRDQPVSYAELCSRLNAVASLPNQPVIRIRADAQTPYQNVMSVLDEVKKRHLSKIDLPSQARDQ